MLRIPQKTSLSLIATFGFLAIKSINMNAVLGIIVSIAAASMCAAFIYNILLLAKTYCFSKLWADMDIQDNIGYNHPVKQLDLLQDGRQITVKVAGVTKEVDRTTTPFDYGLPAQINYIVHIEDLANYSDDELVELINNTYLCQYEVNEK